MMENVELILKGSISGYLLKHTVVIFLGLIALTSLALVDLYFIGKIGSDEFVAANFAAPVLLFGLNVLLSVGAATMIVVSKFVGAHDFEEVNRIGSASIYLSIVIGGVLLLGGVFGNRLIFSLLKAENEIILLLSEYMKYIYCSFLLMGLTIVITNIMRGFGEVRRPTYVMIVIVFFNLILDPVLIFGYGFVPAFGLKGASMATLIATGIGFLIAALQISKYIKFNPFIIFYKWRSVLKIAFPITISKTMLPISTGVVTAILAKNFGKISVAAYGTGYRIDLFVLLFMMALSIVVAPFVGQNYGAGNFARIRKCLRISIRFALIYGVIAAILIGYGREWIGHIFTVDADIVKVISLYLLIVPLGYFLNGILFVGTAVLDTLNQPTKAAMITAFHLFGLYLPMAFLGSKIAGYVGVFAAFPISSFITSVVVLIFLRKTMDGLQNLKLHSVNNPV